jgi:hypothetical protein
MTDFFEDAKKRMLEKAPLICKKCKESFIKLEDGLCKTCFYGDKPPESHPEMPGVVYSDPRQTESKRVERRKNWTDG